MIVSRIAVDPSIVPTSLASAAVPLELISRNVTFHSGRRGSTSIESTVRVKLLGCGDSQKWLVLGAKFNPWCRLKMTQPYLEIKVDKVVTCPSRPRRIVKIAAVKGRAQERPVHRRTCSKSPFLQSDVLCPPASGWAAGPDETGCWAQDFGWNLGEHPGAFLGSKINVAKKCQKYPQKEG